MTRDVYVAGCGVTQFGNRWHASAPDLAAEACFAALDDAGLELSDVEAAWVGAFYPATGIGGSFLVDAIGCEGIPITHVENMCATGLDAFRHACLAVAAGECDVALVCGVDKLTDNSGRGLPPEPATPAMAKLVDVNQFGFMATAAFAAWGWGRDDLAAVAVKNLANGVAHPKAHLHVKATAEQVLASPIVSWPLGLHDCCSVADGAAAVLVTARPVALGTPHRDQLVKVRAVSAASAVSHPFWDPDFALDGFQATREAARIAYRDAGIGRPLDEIDLVEVHDCFTITELLDIQDLGFCAPGDGAGFVSSGAAEVDGTLAVNPSGGLKSFGHPIGATGVRMIQEITRQLQGRAEGRQVPDAGVGMAQNLGGLGGVCLIAILGRDD